MISKTLLFISLLAAATTASAQNLPVLRAQTYSYEPVHPTLGIDSYVHKHAQGKNSTPLPILYGAISVYNGPRGSYPSGGVYGDDTTEVYNIQPGGTTLKGKFTKKYNTAGLITEFAWQTTGTATPDWQWSYTYTSSMLPDTILYREIGFDATRDIHVYNGMQLVAIHHHNFNDPTKSGVDSFFVGSGVASDSVIKHYNTTNTLLGYAKYTRDTANRVLIDSQVNNGTFLSAWSYVYDTLGRVALDSFVYPDVAALGQGLLAYDRHSYKYSSNGPELLSVYTDLAWTHIYNDFTFNQLDSFSYNSYHQLIGRTEYFLTTYWQATKTQHYYYEFPVTVEEVQHNKTLQLYPVPATSYINLKMSFTKPQPFSVRIFDMQGRLINNWQEAAQKDYNKQVPVLNLAPGQYTIHILAGSESVSRQFSVVR